MNMPTPRDFMPRRGSFARALLALHTEPTFDNLMRAYGCADRINRRALEMASTAANALDGESLAITYHAWTYAHHAPRLPAALEAEFEVLARLDEECEEPWAVPLRRAEVPADLSAATI